MDPGAALVVIILGALPFFEARYAIPLAILYGFPPATAFLLGMLGNLLPVIPLLLLLDPVSAWLCAHSSIMKRFFDWLFARTRRHDHQIRKWGATALFLFVAAPIPVTGTWSGCAAAFVFGIRFRQAFPAIVAGATVAALITTLPLIGVLNAFGGSP
ncbi:putative membrane protein [Methanolinea mesophila]|uniref:COG2426 family protein n=1 Tax=Methanolinea mesophila TaxID=547055 RepID=UPI001AE97A08|nr:small multi-drug export protein [Methanolinea mesophila]MBP1928438.1 putative membrane protein [Methanolinea mesophila]